MYYRLHDYSVHICRHQNSLQEAVRLWKGGENVWIEYPRNARPEWFNLFYKEKQPVTIVMKTTETPELKTVTDLGNGIAAQDIVFEFDYQYDGFPAELSLFFTSKFTTARPNVEIKWITPDGREINMQSMSLRPSEAYRISQDTRLPRRLNGLQPEKGLFADPANPNKVLKGTYQLVVSGLVFEPEANIEATLCSTARCTGSPALTISAAISAWLCSGALLWLCQSVWLWQ